jgi:single-stranded DNA-binding protein
MHTSLQQQGDNMSATLTSVETGGVNIVILVGDVTSPLVTRTLANGDVVSTFDIATNTDIGRVSVPISVVGECDHASVGSELCIVGFARRRFFRSGTSVTSRTEVVAESVIPIRRRAQVRKATDRVLANLSEFLDF